MKHNPKRGDLHKSKRLEFFMWRLGDPKYNYRRFQQEISVEKMSMEISALKTAPYIVISAHPNLIKNENLGTFIIASDSECASKVHG